MKWVQVTPGYYKYVEDTDDRPAVHLKKRKGSPYLKFNPSWHIYEEAMKHPLATSKQQMEATDKFIAERDHEMKTDPKTKRWEESRKQAWAKAKPQWRKKMMTEGKI